MGDLVMYWGVLVEDTVVGLGGHEVHYVSYKEAAVPLGQEETGDHQDQLLQYLLHQQEDHLVASLVGDLLQGKN